MADFPMYLTNGLVIGVIYALSAMGVSLIAGLMRVVNFAHGEFYLLGGYLSYEAGVRLGVPPLLAVPLATLALWLLGLAFERLLIRPTYGDEMQSLIVTFVLSIILQNALLLVFGPYPQKSLGFARGVVHLFGSFDYGRQRLASMLLAAAVLGAVFLLIERTWFGRSLRAAAQDRTMAQLLGINVERVNSRGFALGTALAGSAGALFAPIFALTPSGGAEISLSAFVVIVLGGMGSLKGCLIGGLILGFVENLGAAYVSTAYRNIFGFIILIVVLAARPQGMFGRKPV
jgi:branched-chain amino acid transport system permease protein